MPNTKSAIKAARQNIKRRAQNVLKKDALKAAVKEVRKLIAAGKQSEAAAAMKKAMKALDKGAKGRVIHKNKSSRLKSRLAKAITKIKTVA
ncbi:MAG: 30S ribosomal protein S20 [Candidatus Doudnabacteria bacterium]|nr:30S ribosomal protein S20 [Candidatus Doudnabacteria bacterium]